VESVLLARCKESRVVPVQDRNAAVPRLVNLTRVNQKLLKLFTICSHSSKFPRYSEIRVCHQPITALDISFLFGACQDNYRDCLQVGVCLDACQNFTAMYFRQIQVEQDDIGAGRNEIASVVSQKIHGLSAVSHHVKTRSGIDFTNISRISRMSPSLSSTSRISIGTVLLFSDSIARLRRRANGGRDRP
jgi:hypothetical protein